MNETLAQALQSLEIREPISHGLLHMFPLQGDTQAEQDISLLEGALQAGTLHIEEPHEAGSAPELRVVNEGSLRVLILEGDKLIGAKQNRVVNSSVLVAAGSDLTLPVSCIERGRWSYRSRAFSPGTGSPHLALRRLETRSVHDSLKRGRATGATRAPYGGRYVVRPASTQQPPGPPYPRGSTLSRSSHETFQREPAV